MKIKTIVVGELDTNCYLVSDDDGNACVIDPGDEADKIIAEIEKNKLKPAAIINTHVHPDHIGANIEIKQKYNIPIMVHKDDAHMLTPHFSLISSIAGYKFDSMEPDRLLNDGDEIKIGSLNLKIVHTPGHSKGGISILVGDAAFTGDTLFCGDIGRADLYGGDEKALVKAIKEKLLILPDSTALYPGHGKSSTIGNEKMYNIYLK